MEKKLQVAWLAALSLSACETLSGAQNDHDHDTEVISTVALTFVPAAGGDPKTFEFDDPDGDSGVSGQAEPITLPVGEAFDLDIRFLNGLADPASDITDEIEAEAEQHFVFINGDAVLGPASVGTKGLVTHAYADVESDYGENTVGADLPVGLRNTVMTHRAGSGTLRVVLRHLPELNGVAQKAADLPDRLAKGELLPGDVDADVSFELTVR